MPMSVRETTLAVDTRKPVTPTSPGSVKGPSGLRWVATGVLVAQTGQPGDVWILCEDGTRLGRPHRLLRH